MNRTIEKTVIGAAAAMVLAIGRPAWAKGDKAFITDAMKGDNSEIALGMLAEKMGSTEQVRNFGTVLKSDHSNAKKEVARLATKYDVKVTEDMTDEAKQEMQKLRALSGQGFDREFARYMVDDHKKDIADFKKKAAEGKSEVSMLAKETVPVLQKHLKIAEGLTAK